jgi:hypothetical protein
MPSCGRCSLNHGHIRSFSADTRQIPPESIPVERRKYQIVASRRKQEANDCNRGDGHISPSASREHFADGENIDVRKTIVVRANGSPALWTKPRDWLLRRHTPVANRDGIRLADCNVYVRVPRVRPRVDTADPSGNQDRRQEHTRDEYEPRF